MEAIEKTLRYVGMNICSFEITFWSSCSGCEVKGTDVDNYP